MSMGIKKTVKTPVKKGGKKGYIIGIIVALMLCIFAVPSYAQDVVKFSGVNLAGDTIYLASEGAFAVGAGIDILTVYDLVTVRAMYATPVNDPSEDKMGIGVGVNVPKLITKVGGSWLLSGLNASLGVAALTNANGKVTLSPAIYMSVIQF